LFSNLFDPPRVALLPRCVRNAIHWDQINVGVTTTQHLDQRCRIIWAIINPVNHRHLKGGATPRRPRMCSGGRHHLLHRPLPIEWHEKVAKWIARGVK
jgi:hypothetical protein